MLGTETGVHIGLPQEVYTLICSKNYPTDVWKSSGIAVPWKEKNEIWSFGKKFPDIEVRIVQGRFEWPEAYLSEKTVGDKAAALSQLLYIFPSDVCLWHLHWDLNLKISS